MGQEADGAVHGTPESDETSDEGRDTPSFGSGLEDGGSWLGIVDVDEYGYGYHEQQHAQQQQQQQQQQQEQAALRELWGVIDGMLGGPDTNLEEYDYDARSVGGASSIYSPWEGVHEGRGDTPGGSNGSSEDVAVHTGYEGSWWRSFRQGLLLS
jgi:hypothetical protein